MSDTEPTPEEQRQDQRDAWRKAIADLHRAQRNNRVRRKPPAVKVGMHRKLST